MTTSRAPYALVLVVPGVPLTFETERRLLGDAGIAVVVPRDETERAARLPDADLLLVYGWPVDAALIAGLRRCRGIVSYSTGLDHVDLAAAEAAGIPVRNVPDYASEEVAEHALALVLACARKLVVLDRATRSGDWGWRAVAGDVRTVAGRTVGVVGLGRIGRRLAARARGIGLRTIAYDPLLDAEHAPPDCPLVPLDELLGTSDFVSLHAPLTAATYHLIGDEAVARMRPTAFLINTARGKLVDEPALLRALKASRIAGAALDVREHEPVPPPDPFAELPNVILTPHFGAYSIEAAERLLADGSRIAISLYRTASPAPDPIEER